MAGYKYPQFLQKNEHAEFDTDYSPGSSAPNAGIYRCVGCGREIGIAQGHTLPPQGHHTHQNARTCQMAPSCVCCPSATIGSGSDRSMWCRCRSRNTTT